MELIISYLQAAFKSNPDDEDALRAIDLLYDAALVSSGYTVSFFSLFSSRRIYHIASTLE